MSRLTETVVNKRENLWNSNRLDHHVMWSQYALGVKYDRPFRRSAHSVILACGLAGNLAQLTVV